MTELLHAPTTPEPRTSPEEKRIRVVAREDVPADSIDDIAHLLGTRYVDWDFVLDPTGENRTGILYEYKKKSEIAEQ